MALLKAITRIELVRRLLSAVLARCIRLIYLTGRWQTRGGEIPRRFWDAGKPFLFCCWHGRTVMMPCSWDRRVPGYMLISRHLDGQLIAHTVKHFGIRTIAGSTSRGGAGALRAMLKILASGNCAGITPDGPRGPRMRASAGVVNAARLAGVAIVPAAFAARRRLVLPSWDRFIVPLPFTRGVLVWGEPIEVARDADPETREQARREVEDRLNALCLEADRLVGAAPVEPAPLSVEPVPDNGPDEGAGEAGAITDENSPQGLTATGKTQ